MKNVAAQIAVFIAALVGSFNFLDAWLSKNQKEKLQKRVVDLWCDLENQGAMVFVKAPLQIVSDFFDELCGPKIISWKAFLPYSIFSMCFLVCALSITGIRTGTFLGISPSPGESFEQSFGAIRIVIEKLRAREVLQLLIDSGAAGRRQSKVQVHPKSKPNGWSNTITIDNKVYRDPQDIAGIVSLSGAFASTREKISAGQVTLSGTITPTEQLALPNAKRTEYKLDIRGQLAGDGTLKLAGQAVSNLDQRTSDEIIASSWMKLAETLQSGTANRVYIEEMSIFSGKALKVIDEVLSYDTPTVRRTYAALFWMLVTAFISFLNFVCLGSARRIVREMLKSDNATSLYALVAYNALICFLLFVFCLGTLSFVSFPLGAFLAAMLICSGFYFNALFGFAILALSILSSLLFGPAWLKVVSGVAVLPSYLLVIFSLAAGVLFPIRSHIHKTLAVLLEKSAAHEKGVLMFACAIFSAVALFIGFFAK